MSWRVVVVMDCDVQGRAAAAAKDIERVGLARALDLAPERDSGYDLMDQLAVDDLRRAPLAITEAARDRLTELARLLPTVLDESALHELAARLQPLLPAGEGLETGKRLYTATETAELAGVNIETVRRAIRSGQLAVAGHVGPSTLVTRDAIDRWLISTIEMTDNGPRRRPRQLRSLTRCLPTAEDLRSPRAPRSRWCLARRTLREVADIAIGSFAKRAQRVVFAGFGGNGSRCRGGV